MFGQLLKRLGLNSISENSDEDLFSSIRSIGFASATVSTAPLVLGFFTLDYVNPALGNAILKKLGLNSDGETGEEYVLNQDRVLLVGQYYRDNLGAMALMEQNQAARHEAQSLVNKITKKLAKDFANAETLIEIPDEFVCPITLSIMVQPMQVETFVGEQKVIHHFDRDAIEIWLQENSDNPLNRQAIISLQPDLELEAKIQDYISDPDNHKQLETEAIPAVRLN